jgi:general secretion pathway protein B
MPPEASASIRVGRRRSCVLLASTLMLASASAPVTAQDTPEMLAAMRAAMPPLPATIPGWDDLPAEVRAKVPSLQIGMHRWHEDPAERFVLIDGRRVNEGDVAGQLLWLREIRRDGLVLQFDDVFFLKPL